MFVTRIRPFALAAMILIATPVAAAEPVVTEVGTTVVIKRNVTGTLHEEQRKLKRGNRVFRDELLETSADGHAELRLDDETRLALGPGAKLLLDDYVVAGGQAPAEVSMKFVKGAFRFITGQNDRRSYKLETPTASLGIRGTVLDIFVADDGVTLVLLHEGAVEVCSRSGNCRLHDAIGMMVGATLAGLVSEPLKWTGQLVPGLLVRSAFPFVGRTLVIDPVRRLRHATLLAPGFVEPTRRASGAVKEGTNQAGKAARTITRSVRRLSPF